jgi:hypothetical protein
MAITLPADFPIDPKLIEAVEQVYEKFSTTPLTFVQAPPQWQEATNKGKTTRVHNREHKRQVLSRKHGKHCAYCGKKFPKLSRATIDHVIPHAIVQHSEMWNLVLACAGCNTHKGDTIPAALMPLLASLVYQLATLHAAPIERGLVLATTTQDQQEGGHTA